MYMIVVAYHQNKLREKLTCQYGAEEKEKNSYQYADLFTYVH